MARAAVVPWVPHCWRPISSNIYATESPTAGVGARERDLLFQRNVEHFGGFGAYQLSHSGNLKGSFFDELGNFV